MRYLGLSALFAVVLAWAAPASADDNYPRLRDGRDYEKHHAHGHKHYRDRKYRKHRRHHHRYQRHDRRQKHYYYDFHIYHGPYYRNRHHYRDYYYRDRRHRRYDRRRCHDVHNGYRGDYYKWLAGAIVATELIHHTLEHREPTRVNHYRHGYSRVSDNHEDHYRAYHDRRYSAL